MPHPKGSKNKAPRKAAIPTADFTSLIAEKTSAKESLTAEIASMEENLTAIKADLKAKKAETEGTIQRLVTRAVVLGYGLLI